MLELYGLIEPERDLIRDMCEFGLDFFYKHKVSETVKVIEQFRKNSQGVARDLPENREQERGLEGYIYAFLQLWNRELEPNGEFRWRIIRPTDISMMAIIFTTQEKGNMLPEISTTDEEEWAHVLQRCSEALLQPVSQNIYVDGMARVVTDTDIFIIKRNERRLWTRSMAREDVEATLLQAMHMQNEYSYGGGRR